MIDTFTKVEFESALPKHRTTGNPLWRCMGVKGEHCYLVVPYPFIPFGIYVRSSVGDERSNKPCGEDSIRCMVVKIEGDKISFHGGKSQRWVTRVKGWETRMLDVLRRLTNQVLWCRPCPNCGSDLVPHTSKKKDSKIKGQGFVRCESKVCMTGNRSKVFFVTDDDDKEPIAPPKDLFPGPTDGAAPKITKPEPKPVPEGEVCPACDKPTLYKDQYQAGKLYCYKNRGGCGAKFGEEEFQNEGTRPAVEVQDGSYEELRRLVTDLLFVLDEAEPTKPLKSVYNCGVKPVEDIKNFLLMKR